MAYDGKSGIPVSGSFRIRSVEPVDSRYIINSEAELNLLIQDNALYPGLEFTLTTTIGSYSAGKYFVTASNTFKKIYNLDGTSPEYITSAALNGYATEDFVKDEISTAKIDPTQVNLSNYYTKGEVYNRSEVDSKIPKVPSKTSDLTNDSGFITGITVDNQLSDSSTNPVQNKVVYNVISTKANTDHTHDTYAATNHTHDNQYAAKTHTHTLNDITDYEEPDIPTKLSELTNDLGYISSSVADSTYIKKDELVWHEF